MTQPLHVAFLWHMHQPYYKDDLTGEYTLPWVRLHGARNYLHMAQVLADFPAVHATFNLVPSLVDQLLDYAHGQAQDRWMKLSLQESWSLEEKRFLLNHFFSLNRERVIRQFPPYWELLEEGERGVGPESLLEAYFQDLVAWFNLAWIDPNWLERDRTLRELVAKGRGFTKQDVEIIIAKQREIIKEILPTYRALQERGQVELTTSPYYHPILPLLIDVRLARIASPALPLPRFPFSHPEDARAQLEAAVAAHARHFGAPPRGLWPPEGAVGQDLLPLLPAEVRWLASDEEVLARSIGRPIARDGYGHVTQPQLLYRPYWVGLPGRPRAMIFRDRLLSDRIGFVYKDFDGVQAAEDLVARLRHIRQALPDDGQNYLVSIILDGENCWEGYEHNGDAFLHHLYGLLSEAEDLQTVTVSAHLAEHPPRHTLARLFTGSWIDGNFETWIGEPTHNQAWEALVRVRNWLARQPADDDRLQRAWRELYIVEGSDWFWWYSSRNRAAEEPLFDAAFRTHLGNVYRVMGEGVPEWLERPIAAAPEGAYRRVVTAMVTPKLQAAPVVTEEWTGAGVLEPGRSTGAMQRGEILIRRLYYGYDRENLYLRLETRQPLASYGVRIYLAPSGATANPPGSWSRGLPSGADMAPAWELRVRPDRREAVLSRADGAGYWAAVGPLEGVAFGPKVLEVMVPLGRLRLMPGDAVDLVVVLTKDDRWVETLPEAGCCRVELKSWSEESR